jgi:hypothetical protein
MPESYMRVKFDLRPDDRKGGGKIPRRPNPQSEVELNSIPSNRKSVKQRPLKRSFSKIETPQMNFHVNRNPSNGPTPKLVTSTHSDESRNCPTQFLELTEIDPLYISDPSNNMTMPQTT